MNFICFYMNFNVIYCIFVFYSLCPSKTIVLGKPRRKLKDLRTLMFLFPHLFFPVPISCARTMPTTSSTTSGGARLAGDGSRRRCRRTGGGRGRGLRAGAKEENGRRDGGTTLIRFCLGVGATTDDHQRREGEPLLVRRLRMRADEAASAGRLRSEVAARRTRPTP